MMYAPQVPAVTWGQKVLRVEQVVTDEAMHADDNGRTEERLREYLYRQMDNEVAKHLRTGEAWVVQYGQVVQEKAFDAQRWRPQHRFTLDTVFIPVAVQRGQQTFRMFEWSPDTLTRLSHATAYDISVPGFVYDAVLDSLADKRKYVGLTVDGRVRFFERTQSGWKRLW